ncbi:MULTISPECIES: NADP-dependent oxidoreductase [Mycobacterium]|uniref:Alcohol dehydrogenase n=1 Tax=Mycobacterium syngnathidarum TaxID=1908205 RepID=A0A1S1JHS5_9MYCO|nr:MULTISPECIES: NADP-dependent oxidoreductase [Mycobacterium]MCG7609878.1 NADP-dependent oxidoreductase [Mycobacterium sp. CnD-18-1]OHT83411.1 alcohol dehydrogenase [Mycobacterium syngnathidarum]OLT97643.1 alcohol dehydrogenase [Mycobacterium syngnathidarum]
MRAVVVTTYGGPEVLRQVDIDEPHAGPGRLRIRVHAATVNPADVLLRMGDIDDALRASTVSPPYRPGMEVAGLVDEIGPNTTTDVRIGDRVMAIMMPIDHSGGGYAEYVVVDADQVAPAPAGSSHAEAATLPMNGLTARRALDVLNLEPGRTVAVTGAAGAVGGYVVQLAKNDGLLVVADAAPSDEQLVSDLGADEIVPRGHAVGERIRRLHPEGVDAVVDAALQGDEVLPALRDGGQIAIVRRPGERGTSILHLERGINVRDVWVPDYTHATDKLDNLRMLAEQGKLALRVAQTFPAAEAAVAHRAIERGGVRGRLVLTFD